MPEPCLHDFRRQALSSTVERIDAPGRIKVSQRVQASVLRLPLAIRQSGSAHRRVECAHDVVVACDLPARCREYEVQLTLRTGELPFPQHIDHERSERHSAVTGLRLWLADHVVAVGALPDM
jgi:hypothetical protein